jgi:hypothetical protein
MAPDNDADTPVASSPASGGANGSSAGDGAGPVDSDDHFAFGLLDADGAQAEAPIGAADDLIFDFTEGDDFDEAPPVPALPRTSGVPTMGPPIAPPPGPMAARRRARLQARKVRRIVRHVEPWSVLKISLIFYFCLWLILLLAGVLLWSVAVSSGIVENVENFIIELFALEEFAFNAGQIFRGYALIGLVMVFAATAFNVLLCVLFNLISDLTGGLRVTVVEEETARFRPRRATPQARTGRSRG